MGVAVGGAWWLGGATSVTALDLDDSMTTPDQRIAKIATGQLAAFSRRQAHDAGISDRQLRRRVQSGILLQVGPHAFRSTMAPITPPTELRSLVLDVGAPAWITGPTASALHGFDGYVVRRPYHLLLPRDRHLTRDGVRVHRSGRIDPIDCCVIDGLPVTSAVRTLIELARVVGPDELAVCLDSALRDGRVSEDLVHRRIAALRASGRHGIPTLLDVLIGNEVQRGGHSWLERQYLRLVASAGLPRPETQSVLTKAGDRIVRVDCRFPDSRVVVELLGYRFHRTKGQMSNDAARYNALLAEGFRPYQFTYDHVTTTPGWVIATTRAALGLAA